MNVQMTERQLRALALVVRWHSTGALFPCGDGEYLTAAEMVDLDRRFRRVVDPDPEPEAASASVSA